MQARAKSHARIEFQHDLVRLRRVLAPRWLDHKPLAQMRDVIVLFPRVGPIAFSHDAKRRPGNVRDAAQVPHRFFDLLPLAINVIVHREVSAHCDDLLQVLRRAFVRAQPDVARQLLNRHAVWRVAAQHFGHGLGRFRFGHHAHFQPLIGLRIVDC